MVPNSRRGGCPRETGIKGEESSSQVSQKVTWTSQPVLPNARHWMVPVGDQSLSGRSHVGRNLLAAPGGWRGDGKEPG